MPMKSAPASPACCPSPTAIIPLRPPPGLSLDLHDIGPPPGLSGPEDSCAFPVRQTSEDGRSTTYGSSTIGSPTTSDSEPGVAFTYSPKIRLRVSAPAFVPACKKEPAPVASIGLGRASLKTDAGIFTPCLPFVPKARVDQAWEEYTAASTQVQRTRRGVRGGRRARRTKEDKLRQEEQLRQEDEA